MLSLLAPNLRLNHVLELTLDRLDRQAGGPIGQQGSTGRKVKEKDPDTKAFEKELADSLGLKVEIKRGSGETGNLVIKYGNFDQLEYIRNRLVGLSGG